MNIGAVFVVSKRSWQSYVCIKDDRLYIVGDNIQKNKNTSAKRMNLRNIFRVITLFILHLFSDF